MLVHLEHGNTAMSSFGMWVSIDGFLCFSCFLSQHQMLAAWSTCFNPLSPLATHASVQKKKKKRCRRIRDVVENLGALSGAHARNGEFCGQVNADSHVLTPHTTSYRTFRSRLECIQIECPRRSSPQSTVPCRVHGF
ncbi:hypothetical protein LZ31DRAFT_265806 [Colletotrichum somersetense]|nr:hypothetical protein LZ31DRAFT_265806 [Colletotrichum somersetense]